MSKSVGLVSWKRDDENHKKIEVGFGILNCYKVATIINTPRRACEYQYNII